MKLLPDNLAPMMPILVSGIILGALGVWQLSAHDRIRLAVQPETKETLAVEVARLSTTNGDLRQRLADLAQREYSVASALTDRQAAERSLQEQRQQADLLNGTTPAIGPGIRLVVKHQLTITQQVDLLNALHNIGAAAVAINGQRAAWSYSPWRSTLSAPVVYEVLGSPAALESALTRRGGVIDQIEQSGGLLDIQISQVSNLTLPAAPAEEVKFARPVERTASF